MAVTNAFIVDGIAKKLAFLSVKYTILHIFCQKELATQCTG